MRSLNAIYQRDIRDPGMRLVFALLLVVACCCAGKAQSPTNYLLGTGVPTFSTADNLPGGLGFVNVANGNLHLEIPLGTYPQRGRRAPYTAKLVYDSRQWFADNLVIPYQWETSEMLSSGPNLQAGWAIRTSEDAGDFFLYSYTSGNQPPNGICHNNTGTYTIYGVAYPYGAFIPATYTDPSGTPHFFPAVLIVDNGCGVTNILSDDAYATDGSGLHLFLSYTSAGVVSTIYGKDGMAYSFANFFGGGQREDSNGNFTRIISDNDGTQVTDVGSIPSDTLGRHPLAMTISAPAPRGSWFVPLPSSFNMLNSQNVLQAVIPTWQNIHYHTNFQFAGYQEADSYEFVLQKLSFPDNTSYTFTYDCDSSTGNPACSSPANQAAYYGLLTSVALPTGATINFVHSKVTDANGNVNEWVTSRSDSLSGTWNYSLSTACSPNCQTVTMTKPSMDQAVYKFDVSSVSGAWNTSLSTYTGAATGNPLMTVVTSYHQYPVASVFGSFGYTHPISTTVTVAGPSGNLTKQTNFDYESYSYAYAYPASFTTPEPETSYTGIPGKLKSTTEYSYSGSLYRKTVLTYLNDSNASYKSIDNLPTDIQLQNASGGVVAETKITYDAPGLANDVSATINHDPAFNASYTIRGNPTTIQRLASTGNYLSASLTYDTTGQLRTSTDWGGNTTTYAYADNFFSDNGDTTASTPYSSPHPTNAFLTYIKPPLIPASKVSYYYGTGQTASRTDANNNTTYSHFSDPLNRPTSTQLPNGGWTYFHYPTAARTPLDTFQGITSASPSASCTGTGDCRDDQVQLDGLGRTAHAILVSDPDGQTRIDVGYDSSGRVNSISNPYRSISDSTYGTETYPAAAYDGLNRKLQVVRTDGSKAYTYYGPLVGPNGGLSLQLCPGSFGLGYPVLNVDEAGNMHQSWSDAFGRLIEVDEPNSTTNVLSVGTCYAYNLNDNLVGVLSLGGSEATCIAYGVTYNRCFTYDMTSRLLSASHPESGTTSYVNDQDTTCPAPNSFPGQLISKTDARGKRTCFQYDALNRITQTNYSDSTPTIQYFYDQDFGSGNAQGHRTGMSDASGQTEWSYSSIGKVTYIQKIITNVTPSVTLRSGYGYNLDGSVAIVGYPSNRQVTYRPGDAQRPVSAEDVATGVYYANNAHYAPQGALASLTYGGNQYFTLIYNSRLQPCWRYANAGAGLAWSGTLCSASASTGTILDLKYNLNQGTTDNGIVVGITNNRDVYRSQVYSYDHLNRLWTAQSTSTHTTSSTECWSEVYGYDPIGNLLSIQPTTNSAYNNCATENLGPLAVNTHNQISSPSGYVYDAAGNLNALTGLVNYGYDAEGQMSSATTASGSTGYVYDGDGNRAEKTNGGVVYKIYWYGPDGIPLAETDESGNITDEYIFFNGKRIAHRVGP
jgi:YD repeat-containing protein